MKPANGFGSAGRVIREQREMYNFSQAELSRRLGWHRSKLSKIESNDMPLTRTSIHAVAEALEMLPARLVMMCVKAEYELEGEVGELMEEIVEKLAVGPDEPHQDKKGRGSKQLI